jgi:hypothetical protein
LTKSTLITLFVFNNLTYGYYTILVVKKQK